MKEGSKETMEDIYNDYVNMTTTTTAHTQPITTGTSSIVLTCRMCVCSPSIFFLLLLLVLSLMIIFSSDERHTHMMMMFFLGDMVVVHIPHRERPCYCPYR
jgi:biotin transporter BioY